MLNFCGIVEAILKMLIGRNFSMSGINSGHHYLPTYQILMISDNVEFLPPTFYALKISLMLVDSFLKVGPGKTKKILEKSWNFLTKKVYEPCYGKVEISYINVDNF
jgi:hypothetical protein